MELNYFIAILEFDEYQEDEFESFKEDIIIEESHESFFGYMNDPSSYTHLYYSTGPYNKNCILLYYREESSYVNEFNEEDVDSFYNVLRELKRDGFLYLINERDFKLLLENNNHPFPILDIDKSCTRKSLLY